MTIEEMHIAIDLGLQKVNTFTQKNLLSQEKDWFLNDEVTKFIKQRTNPVSNMKRQGTDDTTKRYEDLSDLTRREILNIELISDTIGECKVPSNYYGYISSKASVVQLCEDEKIEKTSENLYMCVFPLSFPDGTVLTNYTVKLKTDSTSSYYTIYDMSTLPDEYLEDVPISKQSFMLLKSMKILMKEGLESMPKSVTSIYSSYWEKYGRDFYNNNFIIVSNSPFISLEVTINSTTITYPSKAVSFDMLTKKSDLWAKTRLIEDEFQHEVQQSKLSQSRPESPVVAIEQGVIRIDFNKGWIGNSLELIYVSKPTILDLLLRKNLNMKDTVSREIVGNTVRFLKGIFTGDYKTYLNENVLVE